jgi:hypothetical protein
LVIKTSLYYDARSEKTSKNELKVLENRVLRKIFGAEKGISATRLWTAT